MLKTSSDRHSSWSKEKVFSLRKKNGISRQSEMKKWFTQGSKLQNQIKH